MRIYSWATTTCEVVVAQCGIGRERAVAGTHLLIQHFAPHILISFGFAGGLKPDLGHGTIVIGDQMVQDKAPESRYQAPPELIETWYAAASAEHLPVHRGTIVTVKHAVTDPASKAALAQRTGACAVDMETAGVAEVARRAGLPCMALRAVVDTAAESLPLVSLNLMRQDGRVQGGRLLRACWQSPGLWRDLFWLRRHAAMARRHLDRTLRGWVMHEGLTGMHERGWA